LSTVPPIYQQSNYLSPQIFENEKYNIWHWKFRSWLGTGTNSGRVKHVKGLSVFTVDKNCIIITMQLNL
jgi:hypothetical protein